MAKGRSLLAHLLHALNQPLTGLQCSLELATAGPRRADHYRRALGDGLQLTGRMRLLVEALRELADIQSADATNVEPVMLDEMLGAIATDLLPVAESKRVRLQFNSQTPLMVRAQPNRLHTSLFRLVESALSLAREDSVLDLEATLDDGKASAVISWKQGPAPEHSPYSRPELGLLIAQAAWEQLGSEWTHTQNAELQNDGMHICTIRISAISPASAQRISRISEIPSCEI